MKPIFRLISVFAVLGIGHANAADDLDAVAAACNDCHGAGGVSEWTDMPTIAGIDAFTHSEALFIYRDRARPCADSEYRRGDTAREATNMCDVAAELSDDDIESLADHYAALSFKPAAQEFDAALAAAGAEVHDRACDRCHSDGGSNPDDEASILAGQWRGYLESSFADYGSGAREQPDKMKERMDELSDDDVAALIHYYASQQ